ncbi:Torso-like protein [Gryllus bimaculatus]|nr:Torso-like protein [Gryllus bimaculatus]
MRVVPRNDSDPTWIFREPTVDIFKNASLRAAPPQSGRDPRHPTPVFTGDFHMEFCDNVRQLLQAYFRDFSLEKLDRPWRAFSGSWSRAAIARHLGINATYLTGGYSFVLVRVARHRERARLLGGGGAGGEDAAPQPELEEAVAREAELVSPGDAASVVNFVRSFGSHYIASYVTGNSLYQASAHLPGGREWDPLLWAMCYVRVLLKAFWRIAVFFSFAVLSLGDKTTFLLHHM